MERVTYVRPGARVVYRELGNDGGGVLLHLATGQYHGLNATGALIWSLLDGSRGVDEVAEAFRAEVPDAPADIASIVETFLGSLHDRDLVDAAGSMARVCGPSDGSAAPRAAS